VFLDDHITQIDPNAEPDALLLAHLGLTVDHLALDLHSAAYGVYNTWKFREYAVSRILDRTAPMLPDLRINQFAQMHLEALVCAFFIRAHQPRIADDVGGQYRC